MLFFIKQCTLKFTSGNKLWSTKVGAEIEILFFIKQCPLKFTSSNKLWSTKVGAKLLSNLAIFLIIYSDIRLDFHDSIRVVPVKYLIYFLAGINTK